MRRFDARSPGQPLALFGSGSTRLPVVLELLGTPWIGRASDLPHGDGSGKRAEVTIEVAWDPEGARPCSFAYRGERYTVDAVVQMWSVERAWWDPSRVVSRRCYRVLARGGTFDIAYDRVRGGWLLSGVMD